MQPVVACTQVFEAPAYDKDAVAIVGANSFYVSFEMDTTLELVSGTNLKVNSRIVTGSLQDWKAAILFKAGIDSNPDLRIEYGKIYNAFIASKLAYYFEDVIQLPRGKTSVFKQK